MWSETTGIPADLKKEKKFRVSTYQEHSRYVLIRLLHLYIPGRFLGFDLITRWSKVCSARLSFLLNLFRQFRTGRAGCTPHILQHEVGGEILDELVGDIVPDPQVGGYGLVNPQSSCYSNKCQVVNDRSGAYDFRSFASQAIGISYLSTKIKI